MTAASWHDVLPSPARLRGAVHSRGPQLVIWVLAIALAAQAALIVTDLAGVGSTAGPTDTPQPQVLRRGPIDIASITNGNLFGAAQVAQSGNTDNAPQTSMPLVLTGIIASNVPEKGFAIVGENAGNAKVHAVGDRLPGGARLHSVESDKVLLEREGHLESLALPRQASAGGAVVMPPPAAQLPTPDTGDRIRRLAADDPGALAEIMRPQPVFAQGKQRGYRVYPGRNRQAFGKLGLRPGDLVVSINGTPLDDPARGQEIFRTIGSSSEARITVMRNGRQQDLTLNVAQVVAEAEQISAGSESPPADQGPAPAQESDGE